MPLRLRKISQQVTDFSRFVRTRKVAFGDRRVCLFGDGCDRGQRGGKFCIIHVLWWWLFAPSRAQGSPIR